MATPKGSFFCLYMPDIPARGNTAEVKTFHELHGHYSLAKEDLDQRIQRKNGFDDVDKMFSSYIDEGAWPYKSVMFDPRPYTIILEKAGRLIGTKPKGKLVPREGGDTLGAYINNELLSYQWDDNTRLGESMISKWIMMDMNARKYGASFAIAKWNYTAKTYKDGNKAKKEIFFDGPDFKVCDPRHVLANPSYNFINKWFQYREWVTIDELERTNDTARTKPIYKNLDLLRTAQREMNKARGDNRDTTQNIKNKTMRGLSDFVGRDEVFKTIEIVTEYRCDRWYTFAPKHGVVLRDIPNPYKHGEIPVVMLKYYPLPDDLYGIGELEPVSKLVKGINSLFSQYVDNITVDLYPPLMVNPVNVRMHTLEFVPEAKWLMNNPGQDVIRMQTSTAATNNFSAAYNIMVGSLLNAVGESSQGISSVNPTQDTGRVTATEIKDTAFTRNVRDNMNQIFLSDALKKQIMFWHSMNQQFMFQGTAEQQKIIRIVGRDAIEFFNRMGLADVSPTEDEAMAIANNQMALEDLNPGPRYAVGLGDGMEVPKFQPDGNGDGGNLIIEPGDLIGNYDYVPDIESMKAPSDEDVEAKLTALLGTITNPTVLQLLAQKGRMPKIEDLMVKMIEATKVIKNADAYFEDIPQQTGGVVNEQGQIVPGGAPAPEAGLPGQGASSPSGLPGSAQAMAPGQNQEFMG